MGGQSYTLEVSEIDTVQDIKRKLKQLHPELIEGNDLFLGGKVLENDQAVKDLGLKEDSELTLIPHN